MALSDLKSGDLIEWLDVLIEKRTDAKTKSDKPYLRLTIRDLSGAMEGVMWDYDPTRHDGYPEGSVVKVRGTIGAYNGSLQATIADFCPSDKPVDEFAKNSKFSIQGLWDDLVEMIGTFTEPLTKYVTEEILLKPEFAAAFQRAPAARGVHNAWYGGLCDHVWGLCQIAEPIIKHYQRPEYCPKISRDKILFGLLLHDAGKILEYDFKTPSFAFTSVGELTPHIVLGPAWVHEKAVRWWEQKSHAGPLSLDEFKMEKAQLMHILAAHHGRLDWGSPVVPKTVEAIIVHHLDNLDAKVMHALDYVNGKPGPVPGFSEKSYIERVSYLQYK